MEQQYQKATAWRARWEEAFVKLSKAVSIALAPEENEDEESDGNMENVIRYTIDVLNGSLHVTFKNEQLLKKGKAELSPMGLDIVERMTEVIERVPDRKITIGSRTTVRNENLNHAQWFQVRELSAKRALMVMAMFEKKGINPTNLAAASLSNRLEEDPLEQGTTVLIFQPMPGEIPRFPEWNKQ
ncbi:MAG: hypothetical protein JXX29_19505 [Deltaproteobacteria bacterium]|nr:hypothetical protein [Deltaproteobacteria bacterium]MBN2673876.1 hypothetical protein [Deltaproteobacteria bacterium]